MGKKIKSKQRLDTYYHYAKQQGYRSRAAYKLIQLNRKYNFLNSSNVLIDLCAAPGGWMQVASQCMPLGSTIVGVDLDPIKRVPGTRSFQGDITTTQCYDQLRKEIQNKKCDVVLHDGAPNVGANWSKDAYTQSQLVLAALKLACSFLKEGGFFVTKVFRSTDFQSLMWAFKKFFERVEATKPKASRFSSAEIFVVCAGYLAPSFIDQKLFDAKYVFQDTEADHFREQLEGQITSIDKLLENRKHRGGYSDDAPMHLYKEATLTSFIQCENPLLLFAQYNRITVSPQERQKYYELVKKRPVDMDQLLEDLRVLGKRQIGNILKWRGKIRHLFHLQREKTKTKESKIAKEEGQEEEDSSVELEKQMLHLRRRQIKTIKEKENKRGDLMVKSQLANQQHHSEQQFNQDFQQVFGSDIQELPYDEEPEEEQTKSKREKHFAKYDPKELERNLEEMYEARKERIQQKQKSVRDARAARKDRQQQRHQTKTDKLKSRKFGADPELVQHAVREQQYSEGQYEDYEDQVHFRNPLAAYQDEEIYLSDNEEEARDVKVDPNERVEGELSDDEAYVIPKPISDMEKRRKQMKKKEIKKEKKLKKSIEEGEEVGGHIQIVRQKQIEDYNIDELAQTLAIAKKMLRNRPRDQILDASYGRYNFEDHEDLPKWFAEDEKRHNFKKAPITKEEFKQQKDRLMAINARVPKKILEAKVRRKIRVQKKLKKTQKVAENVMSQEGVTEYNKLRQVSKLYDASKSKLKNEKKYMVSNKNKSAPGKDSRNVKHVDKRLKKDKRSMKVKKTRQVHRKHKRRGKF